MTSLNKRTTFDSYLNPIVGHSKTKDILFNFYNSNSIPPSIIFYGNDGIGKFKIIESFSKLLCKKDEAHEAPSLSLFGFEEPAKNDIKESEVFQDIKIIEPNANNIITADKIKEVSSSLYLSSSNSNYKIIIINKAECLNIQSNNALLKMLEEPNKNTLFFIICNDINKLYDTVKSRCVKIKFGLLNYDEYKKILENHNLKPNIELFKKTNGSISKSIEILENKIDDLVIKFIDILNNGNSSLSNLQKISEKLKDKNKKNNYNLFIELLLADPSINKDKQKILRELIEKLNNKNTDILDNLKSIRYKYI